MTVYSLHNAQPLWRPRRRLRPSELPPSLADWLFDAGSLTQRLREASAGDFAVRVRGQGRVRPQPDEARALGMGRRTYVWCREVQLVCGGQPWVFARTLIPPRTLAGPGRRLTRLGGRSLGAVLFADPAVRRGPVEVARLVPGQFLHRRALGREGGPAVWGRRSLFYLRDRPLLVCEIFLAACPAYTDAWHGGLP